MITFNAETHEYFYEGLKIPGVTRTIKDAGLIDLSKIPADILDRAQKFGTAGHKAVELDDQDNLNMESLDPALLPYLEGWRKFKKDTMFAVLSIEEPVFSKRYRYAGTLDRRGLIKARHTIIEIKFGILDPTAAIQLEAYKEAWNEGKPVKEKIKDRLVVQLCQDGTYKLPPEKHYEKSDFSVFLSALTLRNWRRRHGK